MAERLSIVHVSPLALEQAHGVNTQVLALTRRLRANGHRVLVLAPSQSAEATRRSRRLLRSAREHPEELFESSEGMLAIGASPPSPRSSPAAGASRLSRSSSLAFDAGRSLDDLFRLLELDIVHLHDPFAPSLSSLALRQSRALTIGSFHNVSSRSLSSPLARRFGENHFPRLDMRSCDFHATAEQLSRRYGGEYRVIAPGASATGPDTAALSDPARTPEPIEWGGGAGMSGRPLRILYLANEERGSERQLLRALRQLPLQPDWEALIVRPGEHRRPEQVPLTFAPALQERVRVFHASIADATRLQGSAEIFIRCSDGTHADPYSLLDAMAQGSAVLATRIPVHEELVGDGERGLLFQPRDVHNLAAQLQRLIGDVQLRERLAASGLRTAGEHTWERAADETEEMYAQLTARRRPRAPLRSAGAAAPAAAQRPLIDVDLHMHTDHSSDCATPVEVLLATARERGLGAIAVTDHNEISGALAARELAADAGIKVIVGEEVKTASQGEVIGLFIERKIERGMSLAQTVAEIKRQGGLVYVPHPFDRLHSVPDYEHLLPILDQIDAIEVFNPRVALDAYNEEARRFAAKYRIPAGAGSDSHVPQGLGSVRLRMRDFDGPEQFMDSLREADVLTRPTSLLYVQALKFLQTRATPAPARRARSARRVRKLSGSEPPAAS